MATHTVTALFDDHASARSAVTALEGLGLTQADVSIVANNEGDRLTGSGASNLDATHASPETKQGAETGAGTCWATG